MMGQVEGRCAAAPAALLQLLHVSPSVPSVQRCWTSNPPFQLLWMPPTCRSTAPAATHRRCWDRVLHPIEQLAHGHCPNARLGHGVLQELLDVVVILPAVAVGKRNSRQGGLISW